MGLGVESVDQNKRALCQATRPTRPSQAAMACAPCALTPQRGQALCPTLLCRSGQAGSLPGYHYLGGWEGMQVELRSQKQDPPKPTVNPALWQPGYQGKGYEPGAENLLKKPVSAAGLGSSVCSQGDATCLGDAWDHTHG